MGVRLVAELTMLALAASLCPATGHARLPPRRDPAPFVKCLPVARVAASLARTRFLHFNSVIIAPTFTQSTAHTDIMLHDFNVAEIAQAVQMPTAQEVE